MVILNHVSLNHSPRPAAATVSHVIHQNCQTPQPAVPISYAVNIFKFHLSGPACRQGGIEVQAYQVPWSRNCWLRPMQKSSRRAADCFAKYAAQQPAAPSKANRNMQNHASPHSAQPGRIHKILPNIFFCQLNVKVQTWDERRVL